MEWLFILILGGVAYYLTERLGKAERRIEELSDLQDRMFDMLFKICFYLLAKRPGDDSVGGEIKKPRVEVCIN